MRFTRTSIAVLTLFAAVGLSGCVSTPPVAKMKEATAHFHLPKHPAHGMAMVYVVRPSGGGQGWLRFNVFVDDHKESSEVGYNRGEQYIYFEVTPGKHKISSKAENWAETEISVKAHQTIFLYQEPKAGIGILRNAIYPVSELEGKYYVKTLKLGTIEKLHK
jgi:hypothetical protein